MKPRTLRRFTGCVLVAVVVVGTAPHASARDLEDRQAIVTSVIDGDTVRVDLAARSTVVRLIGVDTPELGDRHDRSAPPQPFAREASEFTRRTLTAQRVRLAFEGGDRLDRYGRTLAYIFLADGTFFNRELVRRGLARACTRFPFRYQEQFGNDEAEARRERRGLWVQAPAALPGPIIGNRRSRIYHLPGQTHYADISEQNRVYFDSEAAARAAGFVRAWR